MSDPQGLEDMVNAYFTYQQPAPPSHQRQAFQRWFEHWSYFDQWLARPFDVLATRLDRSTANYDECERCFAILQVMMPIYLIRKRVTGYSMVGGVVMTFLFAPKVIVDLSVAFDERFHPGLAGGIIVLLGTFWGIVLLVAMMLKIILSLLSSKELREAQTDYLALRQRTEKTFAADLKRLIDLGPEVLDQRFIRQVDSVV